MAPVLLALVAPGASASGTGTITVAVTGVEGRRGTVLLRLADSAADYESDAGPFRAVGARATGGRVTFRFEALPYGDYAFKAFHDENDNEKLDMGPRGPSERYGFSNDARGFMGPPSFGEARVTLSSPKLELEIELK
jgi:uncharacterized protein (DUF2141 family)